MTPVFRHGKLRLYLLKLLDEAPRHGYEVIRLLQDKFLGVYAPSPGTIYPRLARLEEEGLVTHDDVDGRKVYRITDKGRAEINAKLDDLAELEEQLTESARGIAAGISRDVRETMRSLRAELGRVGVSSQKDKPEEGAPAGQRDPAQPGVRQPRRGSGAAQPRAAAAFTGPGDEPGPGGRDEPGTAGPRPGAGSAGPAGSGSGGFPAAGSGRFPGSGSGGFPGSGGFAGPGPGSFGGPGAGQFGEGGGGRPGRGPGLGSWPDLERLATDFASQIQSVAASLDDRGLREVRGILADAMSRISTEVFSGRRQQGSKAASAGDDSGQADTGPAEPADTEPADTEPADTEPADTAPAGTASEKAASRTRDPKRAGPSGAGQQPSGSDPGTYSDG